MTSKFILTECNVLTVTGASNGPRDIQPPTLLKLFQAMMQNLKAMMTLLGKQFMMKSILGSVNRRSYLVVLRERERERKRTEMKSTNGMKTMLSTRKKKKRRKKIL